MLFRSLKGSYDWFYEGFALYEEQKLGVKMNQIRFDDLLATLGRAYDVDRLTGARASLIDASKGRWAGGNSTVYARGMLVAFLCDVALLDASKGKRSVETVLRSVFEKYRPPARGADASEAITSLLRSEPQLAEIVDRYVQGTDLVDWGSSVRKAGIHVSTRDQLTVLTVDPKQIGRAHV